MPTTTTTITDKKDANYVISVSVMLQTFLSNLAHLTLKVKVTKCQFSSK